MGNTWVNDERWLEWFYKGVLSVSAECGILPRDYRSPAATVTDDRVLEIVSQFMDEVRPLSEFATPADAATAFKTWARRNLPEVKPEQRQTIECRIERDYGGATITLGWSGIFDIPNHKALTAAYDYAIDQVNRAFSSLGAGALPKMGPGPQPDKPMVTFFGDTIVTEIKDGKRYHKVLGGQYSKWGVRIWPETLKQAGISEDALTADEPYPLRRDVTITLDGEKPIKVVSVS